MKELYDNLRFSTKGSMQTLAISKDEAENLDLSVLEKHLISQSIINYDLKQIEAVIKNASDSPEIIGPIFATSNTEKSKCIKIKTNGLSAFSILSGSLEILNCITSDDVAYAIKKESILPEFIDYKAIEDMLESKKFDCEVVVAQAIKVKNGENAKIDYKIDLDHIGTPRELENGKADYKNTGKVLVVTQGQEIAEKIPATQGCDGTNLFGEIIPSVAGEDITLIAGKNTSISEDGMKLFANIDGCAYKSELGINVGETFIVDGDLGFNTGNIIYNKDVFIHKNVLPDFKVISNNGNIFIEGEVDNSYIEALNGEVHIKKGVFGSNCVIKAKTIFLDFVQGEATIEADDIEINKFSYGAKLFAKNSIKVNSIIGGEVVAQKDIIVDTVGSENSTETILKIYNSRIDEILQMFEKIEENKAKLELSFIEVSTQIQHIKKIIEIKKKFKLNL